MNGKRRSPQFGWVPGREDYEPIDNLVHCALWHRNLQVTCSDCGHSVVLHGAAMWWLAYRKGWEIGLRTFVRRLICSQCNRRGRVIAEVVEIEHDCTAYPMPPTQEWKRLVNRQRS